MEKADLDRVPKASPDLVDERLEALRDLFPEAFAEGKVDFDKLRATLGEIVEDGPERYSFTWAGKQDAIRAFQRPSRGTLAPDRDQSVNWDETNHIFIEGENLEVLKLLYRSYFGRVKMIYIDPHKEQACHVCLDSTIDAKTTKTLSLTRDDLFICLDSALDDTLAANLALQCRLKVI
jgi:hypothetical protein